MRDVTQILVANAEVATLWLPGESQGWKVVFDPRGQRIAVTGCRPYLDLWDLATVRHKLGYQGFDWPEDYPGQGFVSRR